MERGPFFYVEHYGLARQRNAAGRHEAVQPRHSWNSDTWFGNALLINLRRFSDHRTDSSRPYEALRSIDSAPRLPTGYAGMILLVMPPPLWFRVMDRRVRAGWRGDPQWRGIGSKLIAGSGLSPVTGISAAKECSFTFPRYSR